MTIMYIDLETVPSQNPVARELVAAKVKPPGNMKKAETIKKWREEHFEEELGKKLHDTCFDGTWGEIVVIGWAIDDEVPKSVQRYAGEPEEGLLLGFWSQLAASLGRRDGMLAKPTWCAHNGSQFDFRFLWQRCVVHGVKPAIPIPHDAKPWSKDIVDTLSMWTGFSKAGGSLDSICKAFGLEGKTDMDGSMVYDEWLLGNVDKVAEYCRHDVEMLRGIHQRMMFR